MEKRLVPEIRFKGFKGDWEEKKLGDVCENLKYGLNAAGKDYDNENKYLRITDIDDETRNFNFDSLTSPEIDLADKDEFLLTDKDIVFARTGASVGKSYKYNKKDGKVYFAGFLIRARLNEDVNQSFIFNQTLIERYNKFVKVTSMRSGQPGINSGEYGSYKIYTTEKDEQEKIGMLFEKLDQAIDLQGKVVEENKRLKQALLQKLFPKKGQKLPELRLKGFSGDWDIVPLGKLGTISSAGVDKNKYENQTEVYLLNYMDVYNKKQISDDNKSELMVVTASKKELDEKDVKKGDIFFTPSSETREDIGHSMVIKNNIENLVYSYHIVRFRPYNNHTLDLNYSDYFANIEPVRRQFIREGQGVQRVTLKKEKFENVLVPVPSLPEQEAIGKLFKALDEKIAREEERLEGYKTLKKSLLQKMFV